MRVDGLQEGLDNHAEALKRIGKDAGLTPVLQARLMELAGGLRYEEIALRHHISMNTVKTEARSLYRAIGVRCRHEIEGAIEAALWRQNAGATTDDLYEFLRLRFE